jgi:hypothetical protein
MAASGSVTICAALHFLKLSLQFPKKQGDSAPTRKTRHHPFSIRAVVVKRFQKIDRVGTPAWCGL